MTTTRPFSETYLLEYSGEHLLYEVGMLFSWGEFRRNTLTPILISTGINNVLIESFVIHLRNLIDFLYLEPKGTDIVACDYFDSGGWEKIRPPLSDALKMARHRANKELAHLTTDRKTGTPPEKSWDFSGLAEEVRAILKTFVANAKNTRLSPLVANAIR
jgi:hypothetical protein